MNFVCFVLLSVLLVFSVPGRLPPDRLPPVSGERGQDNEKMSKLWERGVERLYQVIEDMADLTRPLKEDKVPVQPLTVKT